MNGEYNMDIDTILEMPYDDYVELLLKKYGKALGDYFIDDVSFKVNKSITRSNEGLVIHHIDEDKICNLNELKNTKKAKAYFKYQKANRLVYCNLVEHMLLHLKIMEKEISKSHDNQNEREDVGIGGFEAIIRKTNSILLYAYYHKVPKNMNDWDKISAQVLKGWWTTVFLKAIEYFVEKIENRPDFIKRYGSESDLKKRLKTTHQLYKDKDRIFNQAINNLKRSKNSCYKKKTPSELKVSIKDDKMHVKYEPGDIEVSEMIKSVIETVTCNPNDIRTHKKNDLLSIDVTLKPKKG